MPKEVKHYALITLKAESGEPGRIFWGEVVEETNGKGLRRGLMIRPITSSKEKLEKGSDKKPNPLELLVGSQIEQLYLPKERRDFHKEILGWPSEFALTVIDNGVLFNTEVDSSISQRLKYLESYNKALEKTVDDLCDKLEEVGTRRLVDTELDNIRNMIKATRDITSMADTGRIITESRPGQVPPPPR